MTKPLKTHTYKWRSRYLLTLTLLLGETRVDLTILSD